MPALAEAGHPGRINQIRVQREVELDVGRAGRDRVSYQRTLDLDRMRDKLSEVDVALVGDAALERERMSEDRGGREGDLERVAGDRPHERRLARRRAVDRLQPIDDLVDGQVDRPTIIVPEGYDFVGAEPPHRVVERVHEHPAAELAVAHHVEPALDLALNHLTDRPVLELGQRPAILCSLLIQHGRMARGVETLDGAPQWPRSQQATHHLRSRRAPRATFLHATSLDD